MTTPFEQQSIHGTIIIVDDEPHNLHLLTMMLGKHGFTIHTLPDGEQTFQLLEHIVPDLILLDVNIPGMNGYDVCRKLKADARTQDIPVLFISGLDDTASKVEAFQCGGVDYISKPFEKREVLARIITHLTLRRMQITLQEKNTHLQNEIQERKRIEHALRESEKALLQARDELELRVQERTSELIRVNAALHEEITERVQRACEREAIITVATALRTATTFVEMTKIFLEQVTALLHATGAMLLMDDISLHDATVIQGYGIWNGMTGSHISTESGITNHVLTTGQPYMTNDTHKDMNIETLCLSEPVQALVCVPLVNEKQTIGMIVVGCQQEISGDDVSILSALSDVAASGLRREQLYEQTHRQLEYIQTLYTIDQIIMTSINLNVTLEMMICQIIAQLDIDAAIIMLINDDTHHLEYRAGHGFRSPLVRKSSMRLGEGFAGRTAMGKGVFSIPNMCQSAIACTRTKWLIEEGFTSYYGIPLLPGDASKVY